MARFDFLVVKDEAYLNEVNTIPGFTDRSLFAWMLRERGVGTVELMKLLVNTALEREKHRGRQSAFSSSQTWFKESVK
jgi:hypothetical protein